jgi:hypothetical protein
VADEERRVVLVKPGDLLLIGNAPNVLSGDVDRPAMELFERLKIKVTIFADDIDLDLLPSGVTGGGA